MTVCIEQSPDKCAFGDAALTPALRTKLRARMLERRAEMGLDRDGNLPGGPAHVGDILPAAICLIFARCARNRGPRDGANQDTQTGNARR